MKRLSVMSVYFLLLACAVHAAEIPKLIPFQGHLTSPKAGNPQQYEPVANGQYDILFTLYTTPAGGESKVWGPERHTKVVVVNGLVNVLIGSVNSLPAEPTFFARPLYVGITIDADGNSNSADLELVPRQVLLPAIFAHGAATALEAEHAKNSDKASDAALAQNAANAQKLSGHDWSVLLEGGSSDPSQPNVFLKRSLVNLPPDVTLIGGFSNGSLTANDVGKIVEFNTRTKQLVLSYDQEGQEVNVLRGVYKGDGTIQTKGVVDWPSANLVPNELYYLTSSKSAPGLIVGATPTSRRMLTLIGMAKGTKQLQLNIGPLPIDNDEIIIDLPGLPTGAKPLTLKRIPAGTFTMGSPSTEIGNPPPHASSLASSLAELPQHTVTITKDIYIGKYELTQAQWAAVMSNKPTYTAVATGSNYPVYNISWASAKEFTEVLSNIKNMKFRLPTEAEWEYACRAGTTTPYSFENPNYSVEIFKKYLQLYNLSSSQEVGQLLPNPWGLYDMHGNMWEYCQDYIAAYSSTAQTDPVQTTPHSTGRRICRGGGWQTDSVIWLRSGARSSAIESEIATHQGFRIVMEVQ